MVQCIPHIIGAQQLVHCALHIQALSVVAGVALVGHGMHLPLDYKLVVVQIPVVGGDTEVIAHVLAADPFLAGHQSLVKLLAMAGADDVGAGVTEELLHGLGQHPDGGGGRFLNKEISWIAVLEGEHHQIHRLVQIHQEAGHVGVCDGDGFAGLYLVDE